MGRFIALVLVVAILFFGFIDYIEPNGYGVFSKVGNGKVAVVTKLPNLVRQKMKLLNPVSM